MTNTRDLEAGITRVQSWLSHPFVAASQIYDWRKMKPEDSPTFKVSYWSALAFAEGLQSAISRRWWQAAFRPLA